MGIREIPARTEVFCDVCNVLCDKNNRRQNGKFVITADALDMHGIAVAGNGYTLFACDRCLTRLNDAMRETQKTILEEEDKM